MSERKKEIAEEEEVKTLNHWIHDHPLTLVETVKGGDCYSCRRRCASGDRAYACSNRSWRRCEELLLHEECAETARKVRHPVHPQHVLIQQEPGELLLCAICNGYILGSRYIIASFVDMLSISSVPSFVITKKDEISFDEKDIIRLPVNDAVGDQIMPFVMRERGAIPTIPHDGDDKYNFIHHKHQLTLISSSHHHHHHHHHRHQNEDEEEDDDDHDYEGRSELTCDGCITPIFSPSPSPSSSSSSSSSSKYYYYMSCDECKYYLHWACFNLPPHLPYLPLHPYPDHELVLQSCPKLSFTWYCSVCYLWSNGLFYSCKKCYFKVDVKCASLLPTVHHAAHPQHPLIYVSMEDLSFPRLHCAANCKYFPVHEPSYACRGCEFLLHVKCALLPPSVRSNRWDRQHLLPLTRNANINHPGEFYCDECETEMNPKSWMYHCRSCDLSFHPECFVNTSGGYRNFKFGGKYVNNAAHPHTLAYQLLTTKRNCDVCRRDMYKQTGFHCPSCNFFVCYYCCDEEMFMKGGHIEAID